MTHKDLFWGGVIWSVAVLATFCCCRVFGQQCPGGNCPRPVAPGQAPVPADPNYGVNPVRIIKDRHTINGKAVTEGEAHHAITAGLPSDGGMPFLTIIGPLESRKRVLADLASHPVLSRLRSRWRVQEYAPDEWAVRGMGFVTIGEPTIYLQTATGAVLHRQDSYAGPDRLAAALRQADPDYSPARDPDLTDTNSPLTLAKKIPTWAYVAGAGGLAILFLSKRRK